MSLELPVRTKVRHPERSEAKPSAGKDLALFISKSVLATLLHKGKYTLRKPRLNPRKPVPSMYNYFRLVFRQK